MNHDARMAPAAVLAWVLAAWLVTRPSVDAAVMALTVVVVAAAIWHRRMARPLLLAAVCAAAISSSCAWRLATVEHSPLTQLAADGRLAMLEVSVSGDARVFALRGHESTVVRVLVRRVVAGEVDVRLRAHATAFIDERADDLVVGRRITLQGRLAPAERSDETAVIDVVRRGAVSGAPWWWEASERVREGVRQSVARLSDEPRALVPALVDGDDSRVTDVVQDDFRRSGLTHLMAVSGTNLTIVLAVTLALARAAGLRRGLWIAGLLSIAAFVLLARPEPSVVRAAAMGVVGVAALGFGARGGLRALCWAVVGLLFVDPWLGRSAGFVLSVCATAGILVLAPVVARRLERWLPRWCALAVAVPLAAQLACTPAIAAVSGQVSVVAVAANVLAAPAVAPATIAGLLGGLLAVAWAPLGQLFGALAGGCASWILSVGHRSADLDTASFEWHAPWQVLLVVVPAVMWLAVCLSSRPVLFVGVVLGLGIGLWRPPETGWPPPGWVMVACDVGQGDASVLPVAPGEAVVIDTGEETAPIDHCLTALGIRTVRLLVLTHGDADHVDGWRGAAEGRRVDQVLVGTSGGPAIPGVPRHVAGAGESFRLGRVSADVLWPPADEPATSDRNAVSVVLRVTVDGVRVLLTGDVGARAQQRLLLTGADVRADVLKVPHHGSADQDPALIGKVGARVATISVGADNDYGHPTSRLLALLRRTGTHVWRTDRAGDVAVVVRGGQLHVVSRG